MSKAIPSKSQSDAIVVIGKLPDLAIKFPSKMTKALGALAKALLH